MVNLMKLSIISNHANSLADTFGIHPVYFSLDAGPNLHVLYPGEIIHEVRVFIDEELMPLCEEEKYLQDWVGDGPVQV